jgi:HK97 family phage prohead protease
MTLIYDRSFPLDGIEILSRGKGGDGRTVEAYAAVFNTPTEIQDQHGHYNEVISPKAFARAIDRGWVKDAMVLYNHGRSVVDGRPDSLAQVPIGSPISIEADARGLRTVTRYNKSQLADAVLEAINNGDITAQSFRGPILKSNPPGAVKRTRAGEQLPTITRMELGLTDYGPTPSAYYRDAKILAVRAKDIISGISGLDEAERAELMRLLTSTRVRDLGPDDTATPDVGPGPEDLRLAHSGRSKDLARQRQLTQWAELAEMEMAING